MKFFPAVTGRTVFERLLLPRPAAHDCGMALEKPFSFVKLLANVRSFLTPPPGAGGTTLGRTLASGEG
jgi:hypothetical protein